MKKLAFPLTLFILLALTLSLSACGEGTITEAVGGSSSQTPSNTLIPSRTKMPSKTQTPRPTIAPTLTIDLTEQAIWDAHREAQMTIIAQYPGNCGESIFQISPDENWIFCEDIGIHGPQFSLFSKLGQEIVFSYYDFSGSEMWGNTRLQYWTTDGQFLYFSPMYNIDSADSSPDIATSYNAIALLRMNLLTGDVQTILPGSWADFSDVTFYVLSISPTGRRLAYIDHRGEIYVRDLKNNEEQVLLLDSVYVNLGRFSWSDDGLQLSFRVLNQSDSNLYQLTYNVPDLTFLTSEMISNP